MAVMAARNWTPEQRAKQRDAIQRWKPWTHSTGPTTSAGKEAASRNGDKGYAIGALRELRKAFNEMRRQQRELLKRL